MISASDRENAVLLINEAIKSGASCKKACERLGITERTFYLDNQRAKQVFFLFFAIHLPPVEEGEFLLYIMLNDSFWMPFVPSCSDAAP